MVTGVKTNRLRFLWSFAYWAKLHFSMGPAKISLICRYAEPEQNKRVT